MSIGTVVDIVREPLLARIDELEGVLREIIRLRLATSEGSLRVRADRIWDIATQALPKST